jgi:serine-type D-Ala-D-Ala carboxypeptidase/endopeptidase
MQKIVLLLAFCACFLPKGVAQNNRKAIGAMLDKLIRLESEIDFKQTPCLGVGIIMQDSTYFFGYGTTVKDQKILPTDSTIFEIGSLTKVFTATLLAQAVVAGKVRLTDSAVTYLPNYKLPTYKNKPIRLLDLATHTSGLPKYPYNIGTQQTEQNNLYQNYTTEEERVFLANYRLRNAPFDKYAYSHLGYDVLANALLTIYKATNYETLVAQKITQPLAMTDTRIALTAAQLPRLVQGYSRIMEPVKTWQFSSFQGSMGLKSSTRDLLKFVRLQLDTPPEWAAAVTLSRQAQHKADVSKVQTALGWHRIYVLQRFPNVIVHSGITDGHRVYVAFVPETRTGVVVFSNSENPLKALGPTILQMLNYNWKKPAKK